MQKLLRIKAMFLLVFATTFLISGCNTVQGFGEDVEKLGGAIANAGDKKPAAKHTDTKAQHKKAVEKTQ